MSTRNELEIRIVNLVKAEVSRENFLSEGWKPKDDRRTREELAKTRAALKQCLDKIFSKQENRK